DVEPPDLAAGPEDEGLRIRRPRHVRIDAVDRPGLLEVAIQAVPDRPDLSRAGIGDVQHALAPDPPDERERLAVGRGGRPDRAAGTGEEGLGLAGLPVEAVDDVDLAVRILVVVEGVARGVVLAVLQEPAVGREGGLADVFLVAGVRPLGEHDAVAAAPMVEPDLAGADRAPGGEVFARGDVVAVGGPGRAVQQPEGLLTDLLRVLAVAIRDPDVVAAPLVAGERDPLAVRTVGRLFLPGDVARQRLRLAARERNRIEVAQEVEDDLLA